jgi:predicted MFS family arabinose efflux permease
VSDAGHSIGIQRAAAMFVAFAFSYFLSALLRAVIATLAPVFAQELHLGASGLGLLAGTYFLGFALMQLPLGQALDRFGPRRVLLAFLSIAVIGCMAFAMARGFTQLIVARFLTGVGVAACLMAPLTAFVQLLNPVAQLRLNSWMLMSGSLGMLASTLPVQQLLPMIGWRGLFWWVAGLIVLSMFAIASAAPRDAAGQRSEQPSGGYREIVVDSAFIRVMPLGFFTYGGMIAMQALWAGPWLTEVVGQSPEQAARGLFVINLSMLVAFLFWGSVMPTLVKRGFAPNRLIALGWPVGVAVLAAIIVGGPMAGTGWWALWCMSTSVVTLSQPAVAQAFPKAKAGRALSAFNLVVFLGVFANQWGIGLVIDALSTTGLDRGECFRAAFAMFLVGSLASGVWYWWTADARSLGGVLATRR